MKLKVKKNFLRKLYEQNDIIPKKYIKVGIDEDMLEIDYITVFEAMSEDCFFDHNSDFYFHKDWVIFKKRENII